MAKKSMIEEHAKEEKVSSKRIYKMPFMWSCPWLYQNILIREEFAFEI